MDAPRFVADSVTVKGRQRSAGEGVISYNFYRCLSDANLMPRHAKLFPLRGGSAKVRTLRGKPRLNQLEGLV